MRGYVELVSVVLTFYAEGGWTYVIRPGGKECAVALLYFVCAGLARTF